MGFMERLKIKLDYAYIPDKIKECPRCGGTRDTAQPNCWHCIKCDFAACAYTYKEFKQIKKKYFNIVHPSGRGIRIGKSVIEWWVNRRAWTFLFSFSCWVEEEDNGLKYAHGNIHVLCFCMNFTYWGWPVRSCNWQPAEPEKEGRMFYCDKCAKKKNWPSASWLPQSHGSCEICDVVSECYDVPSSQLPDPSPASSEGDATNG